MKIRLVGFMFLLCTMTVPMSTCSCIGGPTPIKESSSRYELVALAMCESVYQDSVMDDRSPRGYVQYLHCLKARMCILVSVKGSKMLDRIEAITAVGKGSCGINLRVGETYYIATNRLKQGDRMWAEADGIDRYILSRCSGSRVATSDVIDTLITICR